MDVLTTHDGRQAHRATGYVRVLDRCLDGWRPAFPALGGGVSLQGTSRVRTVAVDAADVQFPTISTMGAPAWSPPT